MAWTTPWTWTPGELVTALMMNQHLRDNLNAIVNGEKSLGRLNLVEDNHSSAGTLNDYNPTGAVVRFGHASALTVTGIVPSVTAANQGDVRILYNAGVSTLKITNQSASSAAANRIVTPSTAGQIVGAYGVIVLFYDRAALRWRVVSVEPGEPISAVGTGSYSAAAGAWTVNSTPTGDEKTVTYSQRGKVVDIVVEVGESTLTGTGNQVSRTIPGGFTMARAVTHRAHAFNAGAYRDCVILGAVASSTLDWRKFDGSNFGAETDAFWAYAAISIEVQ